ncbi:hypothetical protein FDECE_7739 [Fusarium decemcellulare]|nr:hypothetical protein FDECE_7739 [Fusarium decemcellulare]
MGNTLSEPRICGICYFPLKGDAPFLNEPTISRRPSPVWPLEGWKDGSLDAVLEPATSVRTIDMKTKLAALNASRQRHCVGCIAIFRYLDTQLRERGFAPDGLGEVDCQADCEISWHIGHKEDDTDFLASLSIRVLKEMEGNKFRDEKFRILLGYTSRPRGVLAHKSHPAAQRVPKAVALGYTGSPASFKNLKSWIKECDSSHTECGQPVSFLPYRVLQLSRNSQGNIVVQLAQDTGRQAPYACLSHRWGTSTFRCRTTTDTIAAHLQCVPWGNLPKTFQEAAEVTLFLGLEYLWIDSLCIIQNDEEDWKIQAAQMCSIYQNSYITLAATSSSDSDMGLFWTVYKIPIESHGLSHNQLFLRQAADHLYDDKSTDPAVNHDFPLLTRGWVYQERILARRVVHFSRFELRFECMAPAPQCECGLQSAWSRKRSHQDTLASTSLEEIRTHWYEIIGDFSSLHLTYHSDALAALAGIARQYGTAHQALLGRYVAGLWQHTLPYDLIWYVKKGNRGKRSEKYTAPTWSWASTTADSEMLRFARKTEELEVVNFDVDLAGPDEYGPINSAHLTLRGYSVIGSGKWDDKSGWRQYVRFGAEPETKAYPFQADYNYSESGKEFPVYCMKTGFVGAGYHVCLVLRPIDEKENIFERIGLMWEVRAEDVESWFKDMQDKEAIKVV